MTYPRDSRLAPWDERYATPDYVFGTTANDFLAAEAHRIPRGRVLCLGDGEGRNGVHLATLGHDVTSMDASHVGLAKATKLAQTHGVPLQTVLADLRTYDPGVAQWQGIVSIFVHLPPDLRAEVHRRAVMALAPGGVFILEAYTPRHHEIGGHGGPPLDQAELLMSLDVLRADLAGLDLVVARDVERDVREGTRHSGHSAVVQVVALKPA